MPTQAEVAATAAVVAVAVERAEQMRQDVLAELILLVRRILGLIQSGSIAPDDGAKLLAFTVSQGALQVEQIMTAYSEAVIELGEDTEPPTRPAPAAKRKPAPERTREPEPAPEIDVDWLKLIERLDLATDEVVAEAEQIAKDAAEGGRHAGLSSQPNITGYRRVIHPEMARGGTCGLCVAASHRVYRRSDLKPIHGGCHCTVLPITSTSDPGKLVNDADLKTVYAAAGGTTDGWTLKQARVAYDDDGSLRPVTTRQKRGKRKTRGQAEDALSTTGSASLGDKSTEWLRSQIATTEQLRKSDWRSAQMQRLRDELAKR